MFVKGTVLPAAYQAYSDAVSISNILIEEKDVSFLDANSEGFSFRDNLKGKLSMLPDAFTSSSNLIDETKITANKVPSLANGTLIDNVNYSASDFIPITSGKQYTQNLSSYKVFYNKIKLFINAFDGSATVTAPTDAAFIRVAIKNDQLPGISQLNEGSTLQSYEKYGYKLNSNIKVSGTDTLKTSGLKAVFLGDSITDINHSSNIVTYPSILKTSLGLASIVNYGISGSTIATRANLTGIDINPMVDRYENMDNDANIVVIFGGTNDYGRGLQAGVDGSGSASHQSALGTFDSRDKTTFYGALHTLYLGLINKYPNALIVGVTPLHRYMENTLNTKGLALKPYVNAVREVAGFYSIPLLDLYANGSVFPDSTVQKTNWMPDGLHPNSNYHSKIIAPRLGSFIKNLL